MPRIYWARQHIINLCGLVCGHIIFSLKHPSGQQRAYIRRRTMARQHRSTAPTSESTRPIARVALYARVSTFNNQDPEMQLAELRE